MELSGKIWRKNMVKTRTKKQEYIDTYYEHYCDLCGKRIDFERTSIEYEKSSYNYGSDGYGHTKIFCDVCEECFVDKIIPTLQGLGIKFSTEEAFDGEYEYSEYKGKKK